MATGKKTGGRKKGTPNKTTEARVAKAAEIVASGLTPLEFMLGVMRDPNATPGERMDAAKSAAPYVHPKLAAIEHTGKDGGPMQVGWDLSKLSDDELAILRQLSQRAASVAGSDSHRNGTPAPAL